MNPLIASSRWHRRNPATSISVWLLLVVYLPGCSRWSVSRDPIEQTVEAHDRLRVETNDSLRFEIDAPFVDDAFLGGQIDRIDPSWSGLREEGYQITPKDPSRLGGVWAAARSDVAWISIPSGSWGWIETSRSLDELSSVADRLRLHTRGGTELVLRNWSADSDSIRGQVASVKSRDWIDIPRSRVEKVSVRQTNVPLSILAGVGLVIGALGIVLGVAAAQGGCWACWSGG